LNSILSISAEINSPVFGLQGTACQFGAEQSEAFQEQGLLVLNNYLLKLPNLRKNYLAFYG
jgi:hypothetical protein